MRRKPATRQRGSVRTDAASGITSGDLATASSSRVRFELRLFVAGSGERSMRAVERIRRLCERHLAGRYDLSVIDIYQEPALAEIGDVLAAPTLVKETPAPLRRVIGDMADESRILLALNLRGAA